MSSAKKVTRGAARSPAIIVGAISPLTRVAGAMAILAGLASLVQPALTFVRVGGRVLGSAHHVVDFLVPAPLAAALILAGAASLAGRLPRFGLAVLIGAGSLAVGQLVRVLSWLDTSRRSTLDLPFPDTLAISAHYSAGAGMVLLAVIDGLLTAVLVLALFGWQRTVMDDEGSFESLRPAFTLLGFVAALVAAGGLTLPVGVATATSLGWDLPSLFDRVGADQLAGWLEVTGVFVGGLAASTAARPRLATVGILAGLAASLTTQSLATALLLVRSTAYTVNVGTGLLTASAVFFAALAVAAWRVTGPAFPAGPTGAR
ncbi:MAG: hypothetical protein HYR62_03135 [Actinobacteria bacterium]|nr:hypothetical protein [Actinomycetota bacterium]MBI3686130.1 hypothetical protein [Actinomycetota bacterium]